MVRMAGIADDRTGREWDEILERARPGLAQLNDLYERHVRVTEALAELRQRQVDEATELSCRAYQHGSMDTISDVDPAAGLLITAINRRQLVIQMLEQSQATLHAQKDAIIRELQGPIQATADPEESGPEGEPDGSGQERE